MGSYDTHGSGYTDKLAGQAPRDPHGWGTAPGSGGTGADGSAQIWDTAANLASESVTRPLITAVQDTLVLGEFADVTPTDTLVGGQTGLYAGHEGNSEIFGGVPAEQFGPGADYRPANGHAGHFRHPNSVTELGFPEGDS
jgi:hypothetical protein